MTVCFLPPHTSQLRHVQMLLKRDAKCTPNLLSAPLLLQDDEAELTEGEYELEDELEDMEDLAEASGQEAASDEDDEDGAAEQPPDAQTARQRKAPTSGAETSLLLHAVLLLSSCLCPDQLSSAPATLLQLLAACWARWPVAAVWLARDVQPETLTMFTQPTKASV